MRFFSAMTMPLKVLWFKEKETLHLAALSVVYVASKLASSKDSVSNDVECDVIFIAESSILPTFLVEAYGLDVDPLCASFTPAL